METPTEQLLCETIQFLIGVPIRINFTNLEVKVKLYTTLLIVVYIIFYG